MLQIEEHIEEITTHHFPTDDGSSVSSNGKNSSVISDCDDDDDNDESRVSLSLGGSWIKERSQGVPGTVGMSPLMHLPLPEQLAPKRVPFPELGADLLHCEFSPC